MDKLQNEIAKLILKRRNKQDELDASALTNNRRGRIRHSYSLSKEEKEQLKAEIKMINAKLLLLGGNQSE